MSNRYPGGVVRKNQKVPAANGASGMWTIEQASQATKSDIWPYSGIANPISQSLRIRRANSAYLQRTPATETNRSTWTYSFWHKRGSYNGNSQGLINAGTGAHIDSFTINSSDKISIDIDNAGRLVSTQRFRDSSAWYHFVWYYDATQATASNRMKVYVNGVEITAFDTDTRSSISSATSITNTTVAHRIGYYDAGILYTDGYMADVNFIDGQALDPSYFGQTSAITGVWEPKQYSGTYGTNGFHLEFKDTTVGKDTSGNNNHWTPNNISTTLDYTNDLVKDVPVSWIPRDGTNPRGNYATLNPLDKLGGSGFVTTANGNLRASAPGNNIIPATMAIPSTGKWYWEVTLTTSQYPEYGLARTTSVGGGSQNTVYAVYNNGSNLWLVNGSYGSTDGNQANSSGDVGLVAVDSDNNKVWIGRSRSGTVVWAGGGNPATGTSPTFSASGGGGVYDTSFDVQTWCFPFVASGGGSDVWDANFGQQPWVYTPPTGYKALCTTNLPTPTIGATVATTANKYFDISLYTGNGTTQSITNNGQFQPDFVWIKSRSSARKNNLYDSIRGVGKELYSELTDAQTDAPDSLTAFNSNGFTLGNDGGSNANAQTFVGWQWNAGNANTTNTSGTITSTVRANPTAGFSVVSYTGNATGGATVGHGLGVVPNMIIAKPRSATGNWVVYHSSLTATKALYLQSYASVQTDIGYWNNTAPTSSVFSLGAGSDANQSGVTNIAYCFAQIAGYSAFGSYTGTGSTNGPFVYCGFRPRWIMIKNSTFAGTSTSNWFIRDTTRDTYNPANKHLWADLNVTESNASYAASQYENLDILSNGFKLINDNGGTNRSGDTMIYAAFAEFPFKTTLAR